MRLAPASARAGSLAGEAPSDDAAKASRAWGGAASGECTPTVDGGRDVAASGSTDADLSNSSGEAAGAESSWSMADSRRQPGERVVAKMPALASESGTSSTSATVAGLGCCWRWRRGLITPAPGNGGRSVVGWQKQGAKPNGSGRTDCKRQVTVVCLCFWLGLTSPAY